MKKKYVFYVLMINFLIMFSIDAKTVILFTGLPCSGKTTLAEEFHKYVSNSIILDGDIVRKTVNSDLGFSKEDREENLRRVIEMSKLISSSSPYILLSFVSPYESIRKRMREECEKEGNTFVEVYVKASLQECINRDVKGMYEKAINNEIKHFTGIQDPYEEPQNPEIICDTECFSKEQCIDQVLSFLNIINPNQPHAVFIGRWDPFHKGHWEIIKKVYEENTKRPLLILVRDRKNDNWSSETRKLMVETALRKMNVPATVQIIPDIDSVNWGRDVGYHTRMIDVDVEIKGISATKIRQLIKENDDSWKEFVCPGVDEIIMYNN